MTQQTSGNPVADTRPGNTTLARHITLFALILYGVGDMVGAGVYATIGKAAGQMGNAVWLAFVASMVAAMLTGLSYANIASRYPRAAGAAYVVQRAFGMPLLSYVVGLAVLASGLTSIATSSNAFAKNLNGITPVPIPVLLLAFIAVLTAINFWGIRESMWANMLCTAIEVGGLLFVIVLGARVWGSVDYLQTPSPDGLSTSLILGGAVLTFFAFVGFEDMLNVAEEVKNPVRNMPIGIICAVLIATVLYIGVAITAVSAVPFTDLPNEKLGAPLAQVTRALAPRAGLPGEEVGAVFGFITLFAVANTALLNYIMGSRMAYGMARQGLLPSVLARLHPARRTPHVAILCLLVLIVALASIGDIGILAKATVCLLLTVFTAVNIALLVLKRRPNEPRGALEVPIFVPILGALVCLTILAHSKGEELAIAGGLLGLILALYLVLRPKHVADLENDASPPPDSPHP